MKKKNTIRVNLAVAMLILTGLICEFAPGIAPLDINAHDTYVVTKGMFMFADHTQI